MRVRDLGKIGVDRNLGERIFEVFIFGKGNRIDVIEDIEKGQLVRQDAMAHITRLGQQINLHLTATPPLDALKSQLPDHEIELSRRKGAHSPIDFSECRVAVLEMLGDF